MYQHPLPPLHHPTPPSFIPTRLLHFKSNRHFHLSAEEERQNSWGEERSKNMRQESSKKRTVVANKINAIFSNACGIARSPMAFGFGASRVEGKEFDNGGRKKPVSASKAIQVHAGRTCIRVTCQRPPIVVASAILAKRWKASLKRVKVKGDAKTKAKTGNEEMELCKKRILMGEKCKALNLSGVLHYDKQGILLPED